MRSGMMAVAGGVLVCVGACLPWLFLFAGLQSYSGMSGLYGRLLFVGGVLAIAGGATMRMRSGRWLRPGVGSLGVLLSLFTSWLLVGLRTTTRALRAHAVLIARPGPGLLVALMGALTVAGILIPALLRPASAGHEPDDGHAVGQERDH